MSRGVISAVSLLIIVGILVALPTAHGAACHRFVGNWTQVASAPLHAWSGAAFAVVNGSLYMTQGWAGLDGGAQFPSNDTVAYDPLSDVWTVRAQAPLAAALTPAATDGRYIHVAGGFSGYWPTAFTNVSRYDTQTDQWTALTPLPADRISGALVLVGSDLHYISGLSSETQMTADHLVLDLANASAVWVTSSAAFPDPKTHIMGSLLGDTIVIPGGQYGEEPSTTAQDQNTTHGYNVTSLTWSTLAPLHAPRTVYASSVWDGRLVRSDLLRMCFLFVVSYSLWFVCLPVCMRLVYACVRMSRRRRRPPPPMRPLHRRPPLARLHRPARPLRSPQ